MHYSEEWQAGPQMIKRGRERREFFSLSALKGGYKMLAHIQTDAGEFPYEKGSNGKHYLTATFQTRAERRKEIQMFSLHKFIA